MHFNCKPVSGNPQIGPLIFDWDEEAGTVVGPGAEDLMAWISNGSIPAHPLPWAYKFPPNALQSREAIAALIGFRHELPAELADAYPQYEGARVFAEVLDAAGNVVQRIEVDDG